MAGLLSRKIGRLLVSVPVFAAVVGLSPVWAAPPTTEDFVSSQVLVGHYMSDHQACAPASTDLLGWPKAALQRCVYSVVDTKSGRAKITKLGVVYLANPVPSDVLAWLRSACARAAAAGVDACVRKEAVEIRGASGAQFPVAGLVWEDMGSDGVYNGYTFRNGVTVRIAGFANGGSVAPSSDVALESLATSQVVIGIRLTGGYARVLSTTREHFARLTGRTDIPVGKSDAAAALLWSDIVGETERVAVSAAENPLITAAVCAHYKFPKPCIPH